MEDPFDYLDFPQILLHGDPVNWKYRGSKPGSGALAHSPFAPPGTIKVYELYDNEFGRAIELHYFRHPDGAVSDVKVTKPS